MQSTPAAVKAPETDGAAADHAVDTTPAQFSILWDLPGCSLWSLEQYLFIAEASPATAWTLTWAFGASGLAGSLGLASDACGDGRGTALFSVWEAASGATARGFRAHRAPFAIVPGRFYRLDVNCLQFDRCGWWIASIHGEATRHAVDFGQLVVPAAELACAPANATIYFGPEVPSEAVPRSLVYWSAPSCCAAEDLSSDLEPPLGGVERVGAIAGEAMQWDLGGVPGARVRAGGPSW
jgi:hypothetical protein